MMKPLIARQTTITVSLKSLFNLNFIIYIYIYIIITLNN